MLKLNSNLSPALNNYSSNFNIPTYNIIQQGLITFLLADYHTFMMKPYEDYLSLINSIFFLSNLFID